MVGNFIHKNSKKAKGKSIRTAGFLAHNIHIYQIMMESSERNSTNKKKIKITRKFSL